MTSELARPDVIGYSVVWAKIRAIVEDMGTVLRNTARSGRISTSRAFACAILNEEGHVVTLDNPLYLGPVEETVGNCLDYYRFETGAEDVLLTNDPYAGSPSIHYFTVVAPLSYGDDIVAFLASQAHMVDIGGVVMGNYNPKAQELWAEGARIAPLKVVRDGKKRRDVLDTLALNSRDPETFRRDLDAMLAALNVGQQRLEKLLGSGSTSDIQLSMEAAMDYTERRLRSELQHIPPGTFSGEAIFDDDGQGREDVTIRVVIERVNEDLRLDFTRTEEQSTAFINSPLSNTTSYALLPLLGLMSDSVPFNAGLLRPLEIVARPGTLVHPKLPAPTGWCRDHVGFEIAEAVRRALGSALPERRSLSEANRSLVLAVEKETRVGGVEEQLSVTDLGTMTQVGSPGQHGLDGWGQPGASSSGLLPSIEEFETDTEVTVARLEYREDSCGAGRWRGSPGTETVFRFRPGSRAHLYACVAGVQHSDQGHEGGIPGGSGGLVLNGNQAAKVVENQSFASGGEVIILSSGGGGFGDPRERPADLVRADVLDGYVSVTAAQDLYGVALDRSLRVDDEETGRLRREGIKSSLSEGS